MLRPEISPQVHNLPGPQPNKQPSSAHAKPLDASIRALVGISQLLLPRAEVVHFLDNLGHHLLHAAEFGLYGFELFGGLDGGPVLSVGADVDVEFHVAGDDSTVVALKE